MKVKYKETDKMNKAVLNEIIAIEKKDGLTAETLLEKAKDDNSSLHDFFEWDDTVAAEKWRLVQARNVINEVKILVDDTEMYAFESVRVNAVTEENSEREYKSIVEILGTSEYKSQLIERAIHEIQHWKKRYEEITELSPIFDSIKKTNTKWQNKKQ